MNAVIITPKKAKIIVKYAISIGIFFLLPVLLLRLFKQNAVIAENDFILMVILVIILILPFVYYFIEIVSGIKRYVVSKSRSIVLCGTVFHILLFSIYLSVLFLYYV